MTGTDATDDTYWGDGFDDYLLSQADPRYRVLGAVLSRDVYASIDELAEDTGLTDGDGNATLSLYEGIRELEEADVITDRPYTSRHTSRGPEEYDHKYTLNTAGIGAAGNTVERIEAVFDGDPDERAAYRLIRDESPTDAPYAEQRDALETLGLDLDPALLAQDDGFFGELFDDMLDGEQAIRFWDRSVTPRR